MATQRCLLEVAAALVRFYARRRGIQWWFQAIDSKYCPAPLGGEASGKSPVAASTISSKPPRWFWDIKLARNWITERVKMPSHHSGK